MRKFTEAQIVDVVREYDAGVSPKELARRLEAENAQMQRIIAR